MGPFSWRVFEMVLNQLGNTGPGALSRHALLSVEGNAPAEAGLGRGQEPRVV